MAAETLAEDALGADTVVGATPAAGTLVKGIATMDAVRTDAMAAANAAPLWLRCLMLSTCLSCTTENVSSKIIMSLQCVVVLGILSDCFIRE